MSTFPLATFDRSSMHWEDYLYSLTPVEKHGPIFLKREDMFAPLGSNSINGSQLRQLIWLFLQADRKIDSVTSGAVQGSPQHAMVSACAKHYGMRCVQFTGGNGVKKSDMVHIAETFGAEVRYVNPGYAATLNAKAKALAEAENCLHIQTNITVDSPPLLVREFHKVGSEQVRNIPDHIETLMVPAGSCNSAVSVLYGVSRFRPRSLKRVILFGIGSHGSRDPNYVLQRLRVVDPEAAKLFLPCFIHDKEKEPQVEGFPPYDLIHYNLNGTGFCKYEQMMPFTHWGVELHGRYEAKCFTYMSRHPKIFEQYMNDRTCFWIVGSQPRASYLG